MQAACHSHLPEEGERAVHIRGRSVPSGRDSDVQFDDVLVLQDLVAGDHLAGVRTFPPETGVGQLLGEVLVHRAGDVQDVGPSPQDMGIVVLDLLAGRLAVGPDDLQEVEDPATQGFQTLARLGR